ncbi:MAG: SDR family oxidoreductase, partial [Bacillota bacterium]|nr:SDR family oxidoreductase [Bacillota bacterium]
HRWLIKGWDVLGTYRTKSQGVNKLGDMGAKLVYCDLGQTDSLSQACDELRRLCSQWDVLILCPGTQEPINLFSDCNFEEWEKSIKVNFSSQLRIVHELLPIRNMTNSLGPIVLFFAGGGTNNATINYSAYTISKIGLIKMTELLDAEITDTRFAIVGPGWVKTKIHKSTLSAGSKAGDNYDKTRNMLVSKKCTPMEDVLDCCDWIIDSPKEIISGRNFSTVFDLWGSDALALKLIEDSNMYKLRRSGNNILTRK